jgi:DNA-binding CsgD family transcriptional regulator
MTPSVVRLRATLTRDEPAELAPMSDPVVADIMAVLKAETAAWQRRDLAALSGHWVHAPETRLITTFAGFGTVIVEGWDAIHARYRALIARAPLPRRRVTDPRLDNLNVVVSEGMAWVSYDLVSTEDDDLLPEGIQHELKIFQRLDGAWRIGCMVIVQRATERTTCPLIEVGPGGAVLWMNEPARDRIGSHPGLLVSGGRIRTRRRNRAADLDAAIAGALEAVSGPPERAAGQVRAVPLGERESETPLVAWVVIEDGRVLLSFDDTAMMTRRVRLAAELYGLSPAQTRLARHLVDGQDLAQIAAASGVTVNTLRTQLQRIFDKTGARSRAALVRALLSIDTPTR